MYLTRDSFDIRNDQVSLLLTMLDNDENINSSNIKENIERSLKLHSTASAVQVVDVNIHGKN